VRETRYIVERCWVDGEAPRDQQSLDMLVGHLELRKLLERFYEIWPTFLDQRPGDPSRDADEVCELAERFCELVDFFRSSDSGALEVIPIETREILAERNGRTTWRHYVDAVIASRRVAQAHAPLEEWLQAIRCVNQESAHPCMGDLIRAIEDRDLGRWDAAWKKREQLKSEKSHFQHYQNLLDSLQKVCPELEPLLNKTQGDPEWRDRLRQLGQAWNWATARAWLQKKSLPEQYERLAGKRKELQKKIEYTLKSLAAEKAWQVFFQRMDDETEQHLTAWTKAIARIGKGTGKFAYRHRRTARQYLIKCIPKMPAWIMPLHKLWETTDPVPGLFDTVIVDEASQASIESLALLLLAKRIVVVGDDKQNSPESVGVLEDDIARLARDHLKHFQFRDEFRPDTSLYDHAERAFGNLISLREHFRCVPEIIRFSNDLCYSDAPLFPLRQPLPNRLPPLKAQFLEQGFCEGKDQHIINRAEAEAIVNKICKCIDKKDYEGKTMGVIALQGHAQAELIEKILAEKLEPKVREERKLRCGVPATFQGDQRDVIFLSLVVAPNYNFRALTGLADQRRFNVAMSRARDQVWLFHSVQLHDLNKEDLRWKLLNFFSSPGQAAIDAVYEELERLEREAGRRLRQPGEQPSPYESWFEVDVALELLRRKYRLRPQVEIAGYRLDLVVEGLVNRLAVECDGEAWHGPERFEHDMARQRQLERVGWTFVRIRESEFYANRKGAIDRIIEKCNQLGIRPIGEKENEVDEEPAASGSQGEGGQEEEEGEFDVSEEPVLDGENREDANSDPSPELSDFLDPRVASPAEIRSALHRIIEKEGPLTKRLLFKLYITGCPKLQRAGKVVKNLLAKALYSMQKAGEIVIEDELGDHSLESQVMRLVGTPKVRLRNAAQRDLMEIPPSELFLVFDSIINSQSDLLYDNDSLFRAILNYYGFSRLTDVRKKHLEKIRKFYFHQQGLL